MGKIIVIEGTDSSGKETQTEELYKKFKKEGYNVRKISFPNYKSPACEPVKMYLAGEFGEAALDVNPYPISTMFAIDRYASYKKDWEDFYNNGGIIITDRYVQSNMIHQASKIKNKNEKNEFINWLEDLEFDKIGIPRADLVIFINMPLKLAKELMEKRNNKITGKSEKDIHEKDDIYMKKSYDNACEISKIKGWKEIKCEKENKLRSVEEISNNIYTVVKSNVFGG